MSSTCTPRRAAVDFSGPDGHRLGVADASRVLAAAIKASPVSVADVAAHLDRDTSTLYRWMRGEVDMPVGDLVMALDYMGVLLIAHYKEGR